MDANIVQQALIHKAAAHRERGARYTEALLLALEEITGASGALSPSEVDNLRRWANGSAAFEIMLDEPAGERKTA